MKEALVTITVAFLFCSTLMAQGDNESSRESLKGLPGVTAVVDLNPDVERHGLSRDLIQTGVELRLRMAGIRVGFTSDIDRNAAGFPTLYINVNTMRDPQRPVYAFSISISLQQNVMLARDPQIGAIPADSTITMEVARVLGMAKGDKINQIIVTPASSTWNAAGVVGMVGVNKISRIRDHVKDRVDEFINAYLSVNPKQ